MGAWFQADKDAYSLTIECCRHDDVEEERIMKFSQKSLILTAIAALTLAPTAGFAQVTVNATNGTTQETSGLTGFATTGSLMAGMSVTAYFTDTTSQTLSWVSTGGGFGGVNGTGWSLTEGIDTFSDNWVLSVTGAKSISSLFIDGGPGDTLFDRTNPSFGSTGSAQGRDFTLTSANRPITVTYSDIVAIGAAAPVGDLYRTMTVNFGSTAVTNGQTVTWIADTDNAAVRGGIVARIPEPGTFAFVMVGLLGGFTARRRKNK
jgi:hypothetical protein